MRNHHSCIIGQRHQATVPIHALTKK